MCGGQSSLPSGRTDVGWVHARLWQSGFHSSGRTGIERMPGRVHSVLLRFPRGSPLWSLSPMAGPNSPIHRSTPTSAEAIGRTVEPQVMIELYGTEAEGGSVEVAQEAQGKQPGYDVVVEFGQYSSAMYLLRGGKRGVFNPALSTIITPYCSCAAPACPPSPAGVFERRPARTTPWPRAGAGHRSSVMGRY